MRILDMFTRRFRTKHTVSNDSSSEQLTESSTDSIEEEPVEVSAQSEGTEPRRRQVPSPETMERHREGARSMLGGASFIVAAFAGLSWAENAVKFGASASSNAKQFVHNCRMIAIVFFVLASFCFFQGAYCSDTDFMEPSQQYDTLRRIKRTNFVGFLFALAGSTWLYVAYEAIVSTDQSPREPPETRNLRNGIRYQN